ncbi:hypothetical protein ACFV9C_25330 [Kribbella sp. NPDC059898]|uniref:terminase small subunit n=1 Tax=Kribbella sp. NPDC059898 TaxID=3346995 RepID=UPI003653A04C
MKKLTGDAELAQKVLNLRRGGLHFDVIADQLNLTIPTARALFDQAMGEHDPEFQRALETDRLDRLHASLWPRAVKGELDAVDRVLRISERRERVAAVPKVNEHSLRKAFDQSATTSAELNPGWDAALVEAGRKIADRVDEAVSTGEGQEVTKALYLIPHLNNVLREMLATPASRAATADKTPPPPRTEGKLAQLRAIQGARKSS